MDYLTKENAKTSDDVERMFNSHLWKLSKAESEYNSEGVLIRMTCERCGAKKAAILMEDDSPVLSLSFRRYKMGPLGAE